MIVVENARKSYRTGAGEVRALDGVSLRIETGTMVAVVGPSGCGKSTLLHCLGALDRLDGGTIHIEETNLQTLDERGLTRLRRERIGFVFQFFNLLPTLSVLENVMLPSLLAGKADAAGEQRAKELLEEVGLADRIGHQPHQLSGGQMQRVALARALAGRPAVLLADEPTGNLDSKSSGRVVELIRELARKHGTTVVMVTHSAELAGQADRIIEMKDGRILS